LILLAAAPALALAMVMVWMLSRRSPLIAHRRVGWQGATLWMLKLRTMWDRSAAPAAGFGWIEYVDDERGPERKQPDDDRVTSRFARFCRRHSIDELPQLWHVIRGEMSLVGPRPVTQMELDRFYGPEASEILEAKPGIAGLWQICGRSRLTYAERRKLDLLLVRGITVRLYLRILLRTAVVVWNGYGAW